MSYPDFESFYNAKIAKSKDIVSKKEVLSLWNRLNDWVKSNPETVSRNDLYEIVKDENNLWMNYPKFYRKRAIILSCLDEITTSSEGERFKEYIKKFSIREFYFCIDYSKISFSSLEDLKTYIITEGTLYREKLRAELLNKEFKTKEVSEKIPYYSYEYVLAASELLYSGMSPKEACDLRFKNAKFYLGDSNKEFRFSKDVETGLLLQIAMSGERVSKTGLRIPNYHIKDKVFGGISEQAFRNILRDFNKIAPEREVSINSIERTALFCKVRDNETATNLTTVEKMEYDSWMNAFS